MDYLRWNDLIATHFFHMGMKGRKVYLCVTEDLINELGKSHQADVNDFLQAVRRGPDWATRSGLCQMALQCLDYTKEQRPRYPAYIAYLALFVLAAEAETDEEFDSRAYYPRLRRLLGEEHDSRQQYPSFERMRDLWEHLADWLNRVQQGRLGIFDLEDHSHPTWVHVGIPTSQALLTKQEREAIHEILVENNVTYPRSTEEIKNLLLRYGNHRLRSRTLFLLKTEQTSYEEVANALMRRIVDEFQSWQKPSETEESPSQEPQIKGKLKLCLHIDEISEQANFYLRCKISGDFPEDELVLSLDNSLNLVCCEECGMGWSSPLVWASTDEPVDAKSFDWKSGLVLSSEREKIHLRLRASPIRLFVAGDAEGLPDLVEVSQLPSNRKFHLVVHKSCLDLIEQWGNSSCSGFEKLRVSQGLPSEWHLFCVQSVQNDELVRTQYPLLSLPKSTALKFRGGIKLGSGNDFFSFAPPRIELVDENNLAQLFCDEVLLERNRLDGTYTLPNDLPLETSITVEARRGTEVVKRKNLCLKKRFRLQAQYHSCNFDSFGQSLSHPDSENSVALNGAVVKGMPDLEMFLALPIAPSETRKVYLIGREIGQIARLPDEPPPTEWSPVWAIPIDYLGQVVFCGERISESGLIGKIYQDARKLKKWKDIIWHQRKRIFPPLRTDLRELWNQFQVEASRVRC